MCAISRRCKSVVTRIVALVLSVTLASVSLGSVIAVQVRDRQHVLGGEEFGSTGPYEAVSGRVQFAVDPALRQNRMIADVDLAPKNKSGQVEFSADLFMLRPRDPARANGTLLFEVSNRGGRSLLYTFDFGGTPFRVNNPDTFGDRFLLERGFTLVWIGWEFDVPPSPDLLHLQTPIATNDGKAITGLVRSEWTGDTTVNTISLGDREQAGYAVADPESDQNKMYVRDRVAGPRRLIPRDQWKYDGSTRVTLQGGFAAGRIYEVVYLARDPVVAGLGLAAIRDFVSFLRYGGNVAGLGDQHVNVKHTLGFGISQSGRFLREFLYEGFNEDEQGRRVFDGVWPHVAGAGRGSFNQRFAQPSRDGHAFLNVFYPVDTPYFDEEHLLERSKRANVAPKLFLTNGSYEYWGRAASLIHTTPDGKADAPPSSQSRVYFFSGSQHIPGTIPPRPIQGQNTDNTNDYRCALRALLVAMQGWIEDRVAPPPSVFPRVLRGELTSVAHFKFPLIAGVHTPESKREAYRLDFSTEPPTQGAPFTSLVPQVDADGNDLGGVKMPEVEVPLGSFTGWNLRSPKIGAPEQMLTFMGSFIPFAPTRAARIAARDPRPSLEERYTNEHDYLDKIDEAERRLEKSGFLLELDRNAIHVRAEREWDYVHTSN